MKRLHVLVHALTLAGAFAAPAQAQTYYGGYNLGPDYGAMVQQMQRDMQQQDMQMQATVGQIARQAMQDPVCQQAYRQHRMQGGALSPDRFGYECARRGRFTPQGEAFARQSDARNRAVEMQKLQELREAEQRRGQAQQGYMDSFQRNASEFGNVMQGNNTWIAPNGQQVILQHTRPGVPTTDPTTGVTYAMDAMGRYHALTPYGAWVPMQMMR